MYLVDTDVWLERLLEQEKSEQVKGFLAAISSSDLFITDFSFHSICVILKRLKKSTDLIKLVDDVFRDGDVHLVILKPKYTREIVTICDRFNLDFDDAYQYVAAMKYHLILVSFDSDFDSTDIKRKTPAELL